MQDLSQYKYFKKFQSPIMDYIAENYDLLKNDFFENIAKSKLVSDKPGYKFLDGVTDLYKGKILSSALKLSTIALDDDERRTILEKHDLIYSSEIESWLILKDEPVKEVVLY